MANKNLTPSFGVWSIMSPHLLKQVSRPLYLCALVPLQELGEICVPDVIHIRPLEQCNALLIGFEGLLKVIILLQVGSLFLFYIYPHKEITQIISIIIIVPRASFYCSTAREVHQTMHNYMDFKKYQMKRPNSQPTLSMMSFLPFHHCLTSTHNHSQNHELVLPNCFSLFLVDLDFTSRFTLLRTGTLFYVPPVCEEKFSINIIYHSR